MAEILALLVIQNVITVASKVFVSHSIVKNSILYLNFYILINEVVFLTNINCSLNCIYQLDGNCTYSKVCPSYLASNSECAYFIPKNISSIKFNYPNLNNNNI